jgi:GH24 family phage-related lysozyme (muramidase)
VSAALDLFWARAGTEEGRRPKAYNDATGETVTCRPSGNLTIGIGCQLEDGLDDAEIQWLFYHRAGLVEEALQGLPWYANADPVRQSVALDVGYNQGLSELLNGYPKMIAAYLAQDWVEAAAQCAVADGRLDAERYAPLRALILSGVPSGSA